MDQPLLETCRGRLFAVGFLASMAKRKPSSTDQGSTSSTSATELSTSTSYTVVARRYRPQQFDELVGQEAVSRALINALEGDRVAHAYLFSGARGVGKTSAARILAKALNCQKGTSSRPCGTCDICQSIAAGDDVDVLEIDGASNRGIDEIREIRQNVQYKPTRARYKVYIVDEVHMLTGPAFNALLKTLEEPPAHVKFIFATTDAQRLPLTILSRCQRFDFASITSARIVERLRDIASREGVKAEDPALEQIARRAAGSMRDAQSLLDQLLAFGGGKLTVETVQQLLGTANEDLVAELARAAIDQELAGALEILDRAIQDGTQLGELVDQLMEYWRDLMVVSCTGPENPSLTIGSRFRSRLTEQAQKLMLDSILSGLEILGNTKWRLRAGGPPRILVEMAIVRLGRLGELVSLSQLQQMLSDPSNRTLPRSPTTPATSLPRPVNPSGGGSIRADQKPKALLESTMGGPATSNSQEKEPSLVAGSSANLSVAEIWDGVLKLLGGMLATNLKQANLPAIIGPKALVLRFEPGYNALREYCQSPNSVAKLEDALKKVAGEGWTIRIESAPSGPGRQVESAPAAPAGDASPYRRQRADAAKHPLVRAAMEALDAQLLDVDEGFGSQNAAPPQKVESSTITEQEEA